VRRLIIAAAGATLITAGAIAATSHHLRPTSVSVSSSPKASSSPTVTPSPANVNTPAPSVDVAPPHVNKKTTPSATPALPPDDRGSQKGTVPANYIPFTPAATHDPNNGQGVWTPYDPHCQADCFPDLTQERIDAAMQGYQGSFQAPAMVKGGEPEFKGLLGVPLSDHYNCEYFHVIGYMPAFKECAAVLN
jgi:hypothetical protein